MLKKILISFILFSTIISLGTAQPKGNDDKTIYLFSVGKKNIPAEEFLYLYRKNHPAGKPEEYTEEKIQEYLDLFVKFKLKVEEARSRKMDTTAAFLKEYNTYREELRKPYLPDHKLIDSLVTLTYTRLKEEVRVSHILINLTPDASPADTLRAYQKIMDLRTRVINGEDFSGLAATHSEDPTAKLNKGDLGYFTALQMVFPFEQAAYRTKPGEVSMPVRTNFGYHLLYVKDKRPSRGEVEVSHIMIRTGDAHDNQKAKNTIFDVYEKLRKGVDWNELCTEYSEDEASKNNGGRLRPFGVGTMSGVPEFEQIAFSFQKPGDFSDPFQTQFGWHIMKLEAQIPLPSFEALESSLKNRVTRDDRAQLSRQALQHKMKKDFGFTENASVKERVLAMADTTIKTGKWKFTETAIGGEVLFSMQNKSFSAIDFLRYAVREQKPNAVVPQKYLEQLYDQYVNEMQGLMLEEKIKREHPDYGWLLNEYYEGILLFEIMEKEVWSRAAEDSTGQQKYYQEHTADYIARERAKGKIFSSTSGEIMAQLRSLIETNDTLQISAFVSSEKIKQETGSFEKTDRPVFGKITWTPGVYLSENNSLHYVVWIKGILPPGPKTFAEARAAVISDYQTYLEQRWIAALKKKHKVKMNKKGQQYIARQLKTG